MIPQHQLDRQPRKEEETDYYELHESHPTVMDNVQFVWAQAEHFAVQAVDHVGCNHEESKPDQEQQKAAHPASQQDFGDDFERFGYSRGQNTPGRNRTFCQEGGKIGVTSDMR
jgi:hypothetical protein